MAEPPMAPAAGHGTDELAPGPGSALAGDPAGGHVPAPGKGSGPGPDPARGAGSTRRGRPVLFHLALLACYLLAGVVASWPRPAYLAGRIPATVDQSSYVWSFWWVAHQIAHLGNPWFTGHMAAPVGTQLGYDTLMPLAGAVLAPVTWLFGPSAAYSLLTILAPGLCCYAAYRAARLWLSTQLGAITAGALYGLATMLVYQDWYHINIAAGAVFLPLALEAAIRLRRRPRIRAAIVLGVVIGAGALVNQESAVIAGLVALAVLVDWLARDRALRHLGLAAVAAAAAVVVASPQIIAMAAQLRGGAADVSAHTLASWDMAFGAPLTTLFTPSPRLAAYGLTGLAHIYQYGPPREGIPTFGVVLPVLAVLGLAVSWRRRGAWLLAIGWLLAAALALGPFLIIGSHRYTPLAVLWDDEHMSALLPYTWFVRIPGLAAFREADRLALLGLLPAALLAGSAVEWLARRSRPLVILALALAALEAGYPGYHGIKTIPTSAGRVDAPIAADHSGSIVVDIPFGLRGGVAFYGREVSPQALVTATADGHPRAVSVTSWVSRPTVFAISAHPFYGCLVGAEKDAPCTPAQLPAARRDALRMGVGWAIVWKPTILVGPYLRDLGFTVDRRTGGVSVYRLPRLPGQAG
ncbi:MAG TPA: hypothetical protein VG123_36250 [Streptosporangiaceae bacterium]|nr:hypothetical protein [Streptosporangiaceae bacterium]